MKKGFIATGLTLTLLVTATIAYAMGTEELACERNAFLELLDRENDAQSRNYSDIINALQNRRDGYSHSLTITDDRERKAENKQVERDYKDRLRAIKDAFKDETRDIKNDYNDQRDTCHDEQKERCQKVECPNGKKVASCDREGNPISNPCEGNSSSSSSSSSRSSSSRSSSSSSRSSSSRSSSSSSRSSSNSSFDQCILMFCLYGCRDGQCLDSCDPYKCSDGRQFPRCTQNGDPINYFQDPCNTPNSSSSSTPVCGDGRCEGIENAVLCPVCAPGTPSDHCACRKVCPADCG